MVKYRLATTWCRLNGLLAGFFLVFMPMIAHAQTDPAAAVVTTAAETAAVTDTLETLRISYALQKECTTRIPETLHRYIQQRAEQEGYGEQLINLRVEFAQASNSSLDLAVIADFKGELGDLYNRLRRAIQRWCVDACSEYGWEIPFPQMTLHGTLARADQPGV